MRLVALGCVLLAGTSALAQPADPPPDPAPTPDQTPAPESGPDPVPPEPAPPEPPPTTEPVPQAPQVTVPAPAPKPTKQTATEARLAAAAACAARDPGCDWFATFSSLEKASVRRALDALKLEIEPSPWGKVIRRIHVHNEDVFAEDNWLQFFNLFHVTTRDIWVRSEMTIEDGEVWDDDRIVESQRRIKDPLYNSVVALLPVKTGEPGKVDVLVVTRDIWSLRLNTQYAIDTVCADPQCQRRNILLRSLSVSISENNFLGRRKTVALSMLMDQGAIAAGPLYIDKNWLRTDQHLDLRLRVDRIFTRKALDVVTPLGENIPTGDPGGIQDEGTLRAEGSAATVTLARPLWSLASTWATAASVTYRNAVARQYFSRGLRAYDDPSTPDVEALPRQYRMRTWGMRATGTRQWGKQFKQQVEVGYAVSSQRPSLLPTFTFDPALLESFRRDVFPRSEVVSHPFVEYSFFLARFGILRNVDTLDLAEDVRFGPNVSVGLAQSFKTLGSDFRFTRPSLTLGWTIPWGRDGFARASAGGQLRIQDGRTIDNTATAQLRAATPTLGYMRLIGQVQTETRWNDTQNQFYTLGAESGLRGYGIGQLSGDRRLVGQFEMRSVPYPVWVLRLGAVAFYEVGGAANSFRQMDYFHDVGFGARMLIPQTARDLFRFDVAFPLVGAPGVAQGRPRFIAGFDSYF